MDSVHAPRRRVDRGFTLVEILVSIVLVGVLTAVVVVGVGTLTSKGSAAACGASLDAARTATVTHWTMTGTQATSFTDLVTSGSLSVPAGVTVGSSTLTGNGWMVVLTPGTGGAAPTVACVTPGSLPVAGPNLWLDASATSSLTSSNGTTVDTWVDLSGAGNTARSNCGGRPTVTAVGGLPYVTFNGTSQQLWVDLTTAKTTIVAVVRSSGTTWGGYGSILERRTTQGSRLGDLFQTGATTFHTSPAPTAVRRNGTALTSPFDAAPVNQSMVLTISPSAPSGATALSIGATENTFFSSIQLAELIVYPRALTPTEASDTERALGAKWGVTVAGSGAGAIAAGASMRLDASATGSITTNGAGGVVRWADQSGNGVDAREPCSGPTVIDLNGKPYVSFNGTSQQLDVDVTTPKGTIFAVVRSPNATWNSYATLLERRSSVSGSRIGNIFEPNQTGFHFNPYPSAVRRNGVSLSPAPFALWPITQPMLLTITPSNPTGTTALSIGSLDASWFAAVQVAELIVYPRTLTTQEMQLVEQYLTTKWGVT